MTGSYTKIYNLGDRRLGQLYDDPLVVEEKEIMEEGFGD